jgi:alpha-beta hydrolase superfamily lysophospholipase
MEKPPDFDGLFRLLRDAVIVALAILLLGGAADRAVTRHSPSARTASSLMRDSSTHSVASM